MCNDQEMGTATSCKISSQVTGLIQGLAASILEVALTEKQHLAQWQIPLGDGSHVHFLGHLQRDNECEME